MIFLLPLALSIAACAYFWLMDSMDLFWKLAVTVLVAGSVALQFTTLGDGVHALVPTLTQVFVSIWGLLKARLDQA